MSKMKRFFSLLLALALVLTCAPQLPLRAEAATVASGTCGASGSNVTWTLDDAGTLTISGTGAMKVYTYSSNAPWYSQRENVKTAVIENGVTIIGGYAFFDCYSLTSVEIPDSVTRIGDDAFYICTSLTSVEIGDSVTRIGNRAFMGCGSLTSVEIPDSVTTIGDSAFSWCTSLTSLEIGDSVTTIGEAAFYCCRSLTSVDIPDSVTTIGNDAFYGCTELAEIYFAGSAPTFGSNVFNNVTATAYYYPDETWTSSVMKDYAGTITWVAREKAQVVASGECGAEGDNVKWELYDDGLLRIFGTGAMMDHTSSSSVPWYSQKANVKKTVIENGVTTIGNYAFYDCASLTSVEIGDSVTTIGECAFNSCSNLASVEMGDSVTTIGEWAFAYCDDLTSVEMGDSVIKIRDFAFFSCDMTSVKIPDSVTTIGQDAFANCESLTSVEIGDSVTTIGTFAFGSCKGLTSVEIPASVTSIGGSAFQSCTSLTEIRVDSSNANYSSGDGVLFNKAKTTLIQFPGGKSGAYTVPASVTTIGNSAFRNCDSLTSVEIPASVTTIGQRAFSECDSLTSVEIGDSVTEIGDSAFYDCANLTSVEMGDSVTAIGNSAFAYCGSLASVEIPDSVTSIGNYAFSYCDSLTKIQVDPNNPNYCSVDGVLFNKDKTTLVCFPGGKGGAYTVPATVTTIGASAFRDCANLTSVEMGDSVTEIGDSAFYDCANLTSVEMGDSVITIGQWAFYDCANLTSVEIPASVTTIGDFAFRDCTGLTEICFEGSAPAIGTDAFYGVTATAYYYPDATWTEEVMQNYGYGTITWVAREKAQVVASGECGAQGDNVKWELYDDGLLRIFGTGAMKDYMRGGDAPWYSQSANVKKVIIEDGVTTIGNYAFYGCTSLTSVEIPDSVTTIGNRAFRSCTSLTSVEIGDSVTTIGDYAFYGCTSLTSVEIPASVTEIGDSAFRDCTSLKSVEIPDSVTTIGERAFSHCASLTSVEIGDSVTTIESSAFGGCTSLKSVEIGDSVTVIGGYAFSHCASLTSVEIPASVTTIGSYAFRSCDSLTSVEIPASVTSIGDYAFAYCDSLTSVEIPDSVTTIGDDAFYSCDSLKEIYFEGSAPAIGTDAFYGVTATAYYYPDATWTEEVMQNYGYGTITWVALEKEEEAEVELVTDAENVKSGDTFTVEAVLTNTKPIKMGSVVLSFDESVFELVGGSCHVSGATLGSVAATQKAGTFLLSSEAAVSGKLFSFQLKVKEGAASGSYTIGGKAAIGVTAGEEIPLTGASVTVGHTHQWENGKCVLCGEYWLMPCEFKVLSSPFGPRVHPVTGYTAHHNGVDLSGISGTPIYATRAGTVTAAQFESTPGNYVRLDHGDGFGSEYLHLDRFVVSAGQTVAQGQLIGYMGSTGESTGPHLHLGITYQGEYVDPAIYLDFFKPSVTLTAPTEKLSAGSTFEVTATLNNRDEIRMGGVILNYDESVFELLGGSCNVAGVSTGMVLAAQKAGTFLLPEAATVSGTIFTFRFKVKETAANGSYTIGGTASVGVDTGEEIYLRSAVVTLGCDHSFGLWEKVDELTHKRVCGKCSQEEIGEHEFSDWVEFTKGDIQYKLRYCLCGHIETDLPDDIFHRHSWAVSAHKDPTCTEDGWNDRIWCTDEGCEEEIVGETLPRLGHILKYRNVTETTHTVYCDREGCGFTGGTENHSYTWVVDREKTCTVAGQKTGTCACGYSKTETIPAGHELVKGTTVDPTCTERGYTNYSCANCSYTEKKDYTDALDHDPQTWWSGNGSQHWHKCSRCDAKLNAANHEAGMTWYKDGLDHWRRCTVCEAAVEVRDHNWTNWVILQPATCTENGLKYRTCGTCGYRQSAAIEATGHDESDSWQHDEDGHWKVCFDCHERIQAAGHSFGDWVVVKAATCFENGSRERACKCGYVESEVITDGHDRTGAWQYNTVEHWRSCGKCGTTVDHGAHVMVSVTTTKTKVVGDEELIETTVTKTCECGYSTSASYLHQHPLTEKPGKAPTCTQSGLTDGVYCEICRQWVEAQEAIPALGHIHAYYKQTATGHAHVCGRCNEMYDATGHNWGGWRCDTAATCTQAGLWYRVCQSCQFREDKTGFIPGHDMVWKHSATEHWQECRNYGCDHTENRGSHSMTAGAAVQPTCTKEGYTPYTCVCGYEEKRNIKPATGHDPSDELTYSDSTGHYRLCINCDEKLDRAAHVLIAGQTVNPTCTEKGYTLYNCRCGYSEKKAEKDALGHLKGGTLYKDNSCHWTFCQRPGCYAKLEEEHKGTWITDREATCTMEGLQHRICTVCGITQMASITKKSHSWGGWITDRMPTCSREGLQHRSCDMCGKTETKDIPKIAHTYGSWITQTAPTCTKDGLKYRVCSQCGSKQTETIEKLGHDDSGSWQRTGTSHWKLCKRCGEKLKAGSHSYGGWYTQRSATCTEPGKQVRTCVCGAMQSRTVAPLGHNPETTLRYDKQLHWNKCSRCSEQLNKEAHTLGEAKLVTQESVVGGVTQFSHHFEAECTECAYVWKTEEAVVHIHERVEMIRSVAPTCTQPGLGIGVICADCGEVLVAQEEIPAYGHQWVAGETVAPTCTAAGYTEFTCVRCGETQHDNITDPAGHQYGDDDLCDICQRQTGDLNGDGKVNTEDVEYLLWHTILGEEEYPVGDQADFNCDGVVTGDDVIRLMLYVSMPGFFPLR